MINRERWCEIFKGSELSAYLDDDDDDDEDLMKFLKKDPILSFNDFFFIYQLSN